jgi:hypothetical protein
LGAVLFALLAATGAAAQEIPAPDPAPTPYISLEGQPPAYHPNAILDYFLWHDGYGWHLRATTAGHLHRFNGTIRAETGLSDVRPLDPSIALQIGQNQIGFDFSVAGGEKGFDWQSPGPGCAFYNVYIDGQDRPGKVTVGASQGHPNFGGFQLCAGGQDTAPPDEVATAEGPEVETTTFQSALSPYGQWVDVPGYGLIWRPYPAVVGADFVPYGTAGHWVYTDAGWMWASGYSWGWAPFHYGNWVWAAGGWGWVPGTVWAPAWVEWRYGGGYVGWAPLAPAGMVGVTYVRTEPVHYTYVQTNNFTQVNVQEHVIVGHQAQVIYAQTQPLPSATVVSGHPVAPVNAGPQPTVISQATGHPVTPVAVHSVSASIPPPKTAGVHYAAGASAERPVAVKPMPPAQAKQYVATARASGIPTSHETVGARPATKVPESSPAIHAQPATSVKPVENAHTNDMVPAERSYKAEHGEKEGWEKNPGNHPVGRPEAEPVQGNKQGAEGAHQAEGRAVGHQAEQQAHPAQSQQKPKPQQQHQKK